MGKRQDEWEAMFKGPGLGKTEAIHKSSVPS